MKKRGALPIALVTTALALLLGACPNPAATPPDGTEALAAPIISPSGGRFPDASMVVSMSCATAGAAIFWTDDDTAPTTASNRYTEPFRRYGSFRIKAIAVLGEEQSAITTASFTLNDGRSPDQLGLVKGFVRVPDSTPEIGPETINIFSNDLPGIVVRPDATGFFVFDGLDTTKAYDFYFTNQELGPIPGSKLLAPRALTSGVVIAKQVLEVLPEAGSGVNLNEVRLKKTGRILGKATMFGRTGEALGDNTGIDVYVPGTSFAGKTDAAGNFTLSYVPEGVYTVRAERAGYTFRETTGITVLSETDTDLSAGALLIYFGYGTVNGQATLTDGSTGSISSAGITVLLRNLNDATSTFNTVTGPDGSYTLTNVEPGSYSAFFSMAGYLAQTVDTVSVTGARTTSVAGVSLPATGGSVRGKAPVLGETDLGGTIVVARNDANGKTFSTGTQADGSYALDPILPGSYTVTASRAGFSTRTITVTLSSGGALASMDFVELVPAVGTITGNVTLEGAADFAGTSATIRKSDDATVSLSATTDAQGTYIFTGLKPGSYLVIFAKEGYLSGDGLSVTLVADGTQTAPAALLKTSKARLAGSATLESASDHAGIAVLATGDNGKTYSTVTDSSGRWVLTGMDAGTYTAQATKDGFTTARADPVLLGAGASIESLSVQLTVSSRSIVGKITLQGLAVHAGTKITATNLADLTKIYSALTNNSGYFAIAGMLPGSYIVSFSKENYKGQTTEAISLASTSSITLDDRELAQATGGIAGIARLAGRTSHAGTRVLLTGTTHETTAATDGSYAFQVPSGNYPGGVRFEMVDFETTMDTETITVLTDSTYGVPTATLAATHNTVSGLIDLLGTTDDSGIAVSVDGHAEFTTTTTAGGTWSIGHVPLGTYLFRFSRANTPDVTSTVNVIAADGISLSRLDMIPNASSLRGYVKLNGMSDHAGIAVRVTTSGLADLTATTNASGYFEIGNILSTGSYAIVISKAGWLGQTLTISDFQPLETRTIGTSPEINLLDNTAPVFDGLFGVVINAGSSYTSNMLVTVALTATEQGSGVEKMQVQLNGYPTTPDWEPYLGMFTRDLSTFYNYTGNAVYTITVTLRDRAGHVSTAASDTIELTSQLTTITGPIADADLHWTKAKSPYSVIGNARVGVGKTLVIDPGVEVRFDGAYYIECYGSVEAVGTASEPILFRKADSFADRWDTLFLFQNEAPTATCTGDGTWTAGSRFVQIRSQDADKIFGGVGGKYHVADSVLRYTTPYSSNGNGGTASGIMVGCEISYGMPQGTVIGGSIHDVYDNGQVSANLKNVVLCNVWNTVNISGTLENVMIDTGHDMGLGGTITGLTARNLRNLSVSGTVNASLFEYVSQAINFGSTSTSVTGSSFLNNGMLTSGATWSPSTATIDLRGNWFGTADTEELNSRGTAINKSFTWDYWDDITKAELDVSGYLSSAPASIGYQGSAYIGPDARDAIASTMVSIQGGSSASIPNGTVNGTWSVSGFSIGKYEVTQAQYVAVMGTNPASYKGDTSRPVEQVSWYNAVEFCNRLSLHAGLTPAYSYSGYGTDPGSWPSGWSSSTHNNISYDKTANGYRLPTEAEWEWAARGGTASAGSTYAGGNTVEDVGWISTNSSSTTHPVGGRLPNELGLYDMSGNVFEWCWDWYGGSMTGSDPVGPTTFGSSRVLRGGAFVYDVYYARVGSRSSYLDSPDYTSGIFGFRVARGSP